MIFRSFRKYREPDAPLHIRKEFNIKMKNLNKSLINAAVDLVAAPVYLAASAITGEDTVSPIIERLSSEVEDIMQGRKEFFEERERKQKEDILKKAEEYKSNEETETVSAAQEPEDQA